jgi:Transposase DDE domain
VMDRGYTDYAWFGQLTAQMVWFVTRLKDPAVYTVVETRRIPTHGRVERDEIIRLTGVGAAEKCPHLLRRVEVYDPEQDTTLVFLTNHLDFGATTIAAIYKDRWQIELFFKALKQNLKIKTFVGTSANALKVQVWTALIAMLLLKYLQLRSRFAWSLSNLVALLRMKPVHASRPLGLARSAVRGSPSRPRDRAGGAGSWLIGTAADGNLISAGAQTRRITLANREISGWNPRQFGQQWPETNRLTWTRESLPRDAPDRAPLAPRARPTEVVPRGRPSAGPTVPRRGDAGVDSQAGS